MDGPEEDLQKRVSEVFEAKPAISLVINHQHGESVTLYREDYQSLLPYRWLRTQAVDVLIKLLLQRYRADLRKALVARGQLATDAHRTLLRVVDAFVVTLIMTDQQDYILESLEPLGLFDEATKYLLIPLNTEFASGSHWLLGLLIRQEGRYSLVIFNSGSGGEIGEELRRRLQRLYRVLRKEEVEIVVTFAENLLYQSNGYDCGVFAVGFSEYVMKEVVLETEEGRAEAHLDNLAGNYKYLLCNSTAARERYRRLLEEEILKSTSQQRE